MTAPSTPPATSSVPPVVPFANSFTAFVLAASVSVTLHETAHAVAGLALGSPVLLRSFSADALTRLPPAADAVMAAAGPVFSLVSGLLVLTAGRRAGRGFGRLFWLWLGFLSTQNFVGYLVITPFGAGDTGEVVDDLRLGSGAAIAMCAVGVLLYLGLALLFVRRLAGYVDTAAGLRRLGLFAWLAGTAVVVARTLVELAVAGAQGPTSAVVAAGAASCGVFVPVFSRLWQRFAGDPETLDLRRPVGWAVVAAVVVALQLAVLAPGIRLG